ncbi:hypothetical protein [Anaerorhabdus sp.]|uniref:hypothetical protein n=1 Tax=Anaerorhabdus sp. TaxID=1872524 RepID=UPI002FC9CACC
MAFYFGNKLKLNIEDKDYTIDVSDNQIIKAVQDITNQSIEMTKKGTATQEDVLEFIENNKVFITKVLGQDALSDLFKDKLIAYDDIGELVCYILDEIGKFKNNRISKYSTAPSNLN